MSNLHAGGCQCGAVRFRVTSVMNNAHVCYCRMCQKATGSLLGAWIGVPVNAVTWTRRVPSVFKSSEGVSRGFCSECGTTLNYKRDNRQSFWMAISVFDKSDEVKLKFAWGAESKSPLLSQLPSLTEHTCDEDYINAESVKKTNNQHPDYET